MVTIVSLDGKRSGKGEIFVGKGSVFEQRHIPLPKWWPFNWIPLCKVLEGYLFIRNFQTACGLYKEYFTAMLSADKTFADSFAILVGMARKGDVALICDCKNPGGWFCHASIIKHYIKQALCNKEQKQDVKIELKN